MTIKCDNMAEFIQVIAGLVREGCTFEAHTSSLEVICTGGF